MLRFFHLATKVNPLSSASPNQEAAEKPRSQTYSNLSFAQAAVTLSRMLLAAPDGPSSSPISHITKS